MHIVFGFLYAPIEHRPRDILAWQELLTLPTESEIWVEDATIPFGHICEFVDQGQHCQLAQCVAEFGVFGAIQRGKKQGVLVWLEEWLPASADHFWPSEWEAEAWYCPSSLFA